MGTFGSLPGVLFPDSFRTLPGFRGRPCVGRGRSQTKSSHVLTGLKDEWRLSPAVSKACSNACSNCTFTQARKRHINIIFFVRLSQFFTGPRTNPVCPWDRSGEKLGQTQEFSLFYTAEARFHRVCPWDKPGLSVGQSRGRRAAQKVYVPFSLAIYSSWMRSKTCAWLNLGQNPTQRTLPY